MSLAVTEERSDADQKSDRPLVNDVVIEVATKNGSGSTSSNLILMRSIFNMGIPVSAKNLFPSNIEGLPTWFTIRANEDGWLARRERSDFLICMNPETAADDIAQFRSGGFLILNEALKGFIKRDDLHVLAIPFDKLIKEACPDARLRKKIINVLYVGVMAYLLDIDMEEVKNATRKQFAKKAKAAELNINATAAGYQWAKDNLERQTQFTLRPSEASRGKIIIEGNQATALGMVFGGATVCAWYPITPSSSCGEAFTQYCEQYRNDPETGKATYAIIQAEDELASIAMVIGAGWTGARAFTCTSGPGISLMAEAAGLAHFAEIPAVIVDVQRLGPSTGLPTRTSQGDIASAYQLSHGDCKHVLLLPGNVQESYEFAQTALDLAERLQTLVFLMTDLDLGMNNWMTDPFEFPDKPFDRGKVLTVEDLEKNGEFARYRDVDGDGIPYRTLPGTNHPNAAYFTRGTGHNDEASYSEKPADWQANLDRLARKFETARDLAPQPIVDETQGAELGIIAFGSSDMAVGEARHLLANREGIKTDYLRLRALPAGPAVRKFIEGHGLTCMIEQNRDGQVASILKAELPDLATKIKSVLHYNGIPIDAETLVTQVKAIHEEEKSG